MLFKLVIPYVDRMIENGVITKWHKQEGEWVNYGDDLFDLKADAVKFLRRAGSPLKILKNPFKIKAIGKHFRHNRISVVRFTASDTGFLRAIYVKEGERRAVGDLLAALSTDENEPIHRDDPTFKDATEFRLASNIIDVWGGELVE
jgi:hypothetical protein